MEHQLKINNITAKGIFLYAFQSVEKGPAYAGLFVIYMVKYMW